MMTEGVEHEKPENAASFWNNYWFSVAGIGQTGCRSLETSSPVWLLTNRALGFWKRLSDGSLWQVCGSLPQSSCGNPGEGW